MPYMGALGGGRPNPGRMIKSQQVHPLSVNWTRRRLFIGRAFGRERGVRIFGWGERVLRADTASVVLAGFTA